VIKIQAIQQALSSLSASMLVWRGLNGVNLAKISGFLLRTLYCKSATTTKNDNIVDKIIRNQGNESL